MKEDGVKPTKLKKVLVVIVDVLFVLFFIVCAVALTASIASKRDSDGAIRLFGYEMRLVVTESMQKNDSVDVSEYEIADIPVKSLIFIQTVPEDAAQAEQWYSQLKVGDVLTFRYVYDKQVTITHRIVDIEPKEGGGYFISLRGDNAAGGTEAGIQLIDTSDSGGVNYVIGKVTGVSTVLGYILTAVKSPLGIVLIVIVPCVVIIIMEIIRIHGAVTQKRREKDEAEKRKKDEEIEELKRRLSEVEARAEADESLKDNGGDT